MKPYNPLEKENLGKSVTDSLVRSPAIPLGDITPFKGAGVYAIYYTGSFPCYSPLRERTSGVAQDPPIYVGKAVPTGGRKGKVDPEVSSKGSKLFSRLEEHRKSIVAATNLNIADFWCRHLIVDDIWIPLGESLLIQRFQPIWNSVVDGFGNHDPGAGRYKGARPSWDILHPGRSWAEKCASSKLSGSDILASIQEFWMSHPDPVDQD